jgi:hypothetical protein
MQKKKQIRGDLDRCRRYGTVRWVFDDYIKVCTVNMLDSVESCWVCVEKEEKGSKWIHRLSYLARSSDADSGRVIRTAQGPVNDRFVEQGIEAESQRPAVQLAGILT